MIKSVLFDLDGTLLPLNQDEFAKEYLRQLAGYMAPYIDPQRLVEHLWASTNVMVANCDKNKTNQEVFMNDFLARIGIPKKNILPEINAFYERHFNKIRSVARPNKAAREAVLAAKEQDCDVVVATNPLFPASAIKQRLEWAGVGDISFKLITSYENCCFCKPHREYYLDIADKIGREPEECLMIGNDVEEDLAAATIGMKTYLVTDCLINAKNMEIKADYTGSLTDLADNLKNILSR